MTNTGNTQRPQTTLDVERTELLAELADARSALTAKAQDLTVEQLGERSTVSALCLGGLIKHVAAMEENWLRFVVEGPEVMRFDLPDGVAFSDIMAGTATEIPQWIIDHEADFQMQPDDTLASILERYERVAARTAEIVAGVPDLSATQEVPAAPWGQPAAQWSVRRVLLHAIAETYQHAGHADIIRETIDAQTAN